LDREDNPNVKEIIRRFNADEEDFLDIDFDYIKINNSTLEDFYNGAEEIACQVETTLAQGRN
jgi:hypothetical protein